MFTLLTDIGKQKLADLQPTDKVELISFQVGKYSGALEDLHDVDVDNNKVFAVSNLPNFNSGHDGPEADIFYRFLDDTNTILKIFVPQHIVYFKINMIVLHARIGVEDFPLLVSYSLEDNPKFSTVTNVYGTRYFYMLQLDIADRVTRFDFTNLQTETPTFAFFDHNYDAPQAYRIKNDQVIVENHVNVPEGYGALAIDSEGQHFGVVLMPWSIYDILEALQINDENLELDGEYLFLNVVDDPKDIILNNPK